MRLQSLKSSKKSIYHKKSRYYFYSQFQKFFFLDFLFAYLQGRNLKLRSNFSSLHSGHVSAQNAKRRVAPSLNIKFNLIIILLNFTINRSVITHWCMTALSFIFIHFYRRAERADRNERVYIYKHLDTFQKAL